MKVNRKWVRRNMGYDPLDAPLPASTYAYPAASRPDASDEDLQREIIDFDSESASGLRYLAFTSSTGLSRFVDIPWPAGLAPVAGAAPRGAAGSALPRADVLVVTWTMDEGHALSRVLTPGKDSDADYVPYTHNYAAFAKKMVAGCPARQLKRLGTFWPAQIGSTSVLVFKSDCHLSQDGPQMPIIGVWQQLLAEVQPKLVLTTGTAGGIGKEFEVGDVVVSPVVRFDCTSKFKSAPFHDAHFASVAAKPKNFKVAQKLFKTNSARLPPDNSRQPQIFNVAVDALDQSVVTTDFFGFDTSDNTYRLQGLGDVSEMGDAVLGLVVSQMTTAPPRWLAVRNVSDPQISANGMTLAEEAKLAASIYKSFGRWSSICSAITCWALIAAE